jgi:hypothetical protein
MKIAKKAAFFSSYPPRKCGIATFTADLIANIKLASKGEFDPESNEVGDACHFLGYL